MFGHSAGAQFVTRFVTFMPQHRPIAVAANAGWYTTLDDLVEFPTGWTVPPRRKTNCTLRSPRTRHSARKQ
jgi:hypothetical protein